MKHITVVTNPVMEILCAFEEEEDAQDFLQELDGFVSDGQSNTLKEGDVAELLVETVPIFSDDVVQAISDLHGLEKI